MAAGIKHSENCSDCRECIVCTRHGRILKVCDICYRAQVVAKLVARKIRRVLHEGCLILYYVDGWRVGYLVKLGVSAASVQPIGGFGGSIPENIRVPLTDIKPEIITSAKCPQTVEEYYAMNERKKVLLVADQTSSAVTKAVEYLMNRPVEHTFGSAPALTPEDVPVIVQSPEASAEPQKVNKKPKPPKKLTPEEQPVVAGLDLAEKVSPSEAKPRLKHAVVNLEEIVRLHAAGTAINDIVDAVKGTRAVFDVKKLVRKHLKNLNLLKD